MVLRPRRNPLGPVPGGELKRPAASGAVAGGRSGVARRPARWAFARNVKGLLDDLPAPPQAPAAGRGALAAPRFAAARASAAAVAGARPRLPPAGSIPSTFCWACSAGIAASILSIRRQRSRRCWAMAGWPWRPWPPWPRGHLQPALEEPLPFAVRRGGLVAIVVLQYVAARLLRALGRLNRNTPGRISSTAVPDCLAVLALAAGLVTSWGCWSRARAIDYGLVPTAVLACIFCEYAACVAPVPCGLTDYGCAGGRGKGVALGVALVPGGVRRAARAVAYGLGVVAAAVRLCCTPPSPCCPSRSPPVRIRPQGGYGRVAPPLPLRHFAIGGVRAIPGLSLADRRDPRTAEYQGEGRSVLGLGTWVLGLRT